LQATTPRRGAPRTAGSRWSAAFSSPRTDRPGRAFLFRRGLC
jgi:hypothetical protein